MTKNTEKVKGEFLKLDILPLKRLGQNFLTDGRTVVSAVDAAELKPRENVLEVGGGTGILTEEMARRGATVVTVEKDARLVPFLEKIAASYPNVTPVHGDILDINPELYFKNTPYKLVGNPPYYLTGHLLRRFLEEVATRPSQVVLIIQKEVAKKVVAKPPEMNLLALSVRVFGEPRVTRVISKGSFWPQPKVDSALLVIDVKRQNWLREGEIKDFFAIAHAAFRQQRKKLRNSLGKSLGFSSKEVQSWLEKAEVSGDRRPETLTLEEWAGIFGTRPQGTYHGASIKY